MSCFRNIHFIFHIYALKITLINEKSIASLQIVLLYDQKETLHAGTSTVTCL